MNKIKRIFNQNRELIFRVIIIIVVGFGLLQLLNFIAKKQNEENANVSANRNATYDRDYEIISGSRKDNETYDEENSIIEDFLNYCNNKEFENAYNILSQECKNAIFPNLETFVSEYGEKIFFNKRDYNIQAWTSNIYRVRITDNLLETGSIGDSNYIEDYFSVVRK